MSDRVKRLVHDTILSSSHWKGKDTTLGDAIVLTDDIVAALETRQEVDHPQLGYATTEELLIELRARMNLENPRQAAIAERITDALNNLSLAVLQYSTMEKGT